MRSVARQFIVGLLFASVFVAIQRSNGLPFWPLVAIYVLGGTLQHVKGWVK